MADNERPTSIRYDPRPYEETVENPKGGYAIFVRTDWEPEKNNINPYPAIIK